MNEETLFAEALGKQGPARAAFLDEHCKGDVELRKRLEDLVRAHDYPDPFLEAAAPVVTVDVPITEAPGTVIGPYKLLQQIGEGGFGIVFMAEQQKPVRRKVALKVLKPGMDTRQVVARFEAERQALALMDHPNIARVFDGGQTPAGRPYFVMELVRGSPITEYCDQNKLGLRERLDLFVTVCQAVQHAHQKGIIHRDLKPSNILIVSHDGTPVPKVIDFGIAKAMSGNLTDKTLFTQFEQMIGTPLYMSPEQAGQSGLDVDTRSDIYALGVLLYELLTGTTPFDKEQFSRLGYHELRRIICETEPPKPSTHFSTLDQAATTASTNRQSEPRKLSQQIRGELDWIVMKALEKDRNRRYESASNFAADVQRYLNDEAVQACPPSAVYRLRKFARRNKTAMLAVLAVFVALSAGMASTTVALFEAQNQRDVAENDRSEAEKARVDAEKARVDAEKARIEERKLREKAQEDEVKARDYEYRVQAFFCEKVFQPWRPESRGGLGKDVTVRQVIEAAEKEITPSFKDRPLIEVGVRISLAENYHDCGEAEVARTLLRRSAEMVKDGFIPDEYYSFLAVELVSRVQRKTGNFDQALALLQDILARLMETLGPDALHTLAIVNNVYYTYADMGQAHLGVPLLKKHLAAVDAKLGPDHPLTLRSRYNLGFVYAETGHLDLAVPIFEEVHQKEKKSLGADHPSTLVTMSSLGSAYVAVGKMNPGLRLMEEAVAAQKERLGPDHRQTLTSLENLIDGYLKAKQPEKAMPLLQPYLDGQKKHLRPSNHEVDANQVLKALHRLNGEKPFAAYFVTERSMIARANERTPEAAKAAPFLTECLSIRVREFPDEWTTFNTESMLGGSLVGLKQYKMAEPFLLNGYKGMKEREGKLAPARRVHLTEALERLVQLYDAWGKKDEAVKWQKNLAAHRESEKKIEKPKDQP